jgi:hypothetical protein
MARSVRTWFAVSVALLSGVVAACAGSAPGGSGSAPSVAADAGRPQVVILSPPANAQVALGQPVDVVTTGVDAIGVARIDLKVNDSTISSAEAPPGGLPSFSAVHVWTPSTAGPATLSVVAYRADGAPSDPMAIAVLVLPAGATAAPYATYGGAVPTYRASAVAGNYAEPTYKANATYGAAPTYQAGATATAYAGATPTDYVGATPTYAVDATPTYAVDATPTIDPGMSIAPEDANYTLVIPYRGQNAVSDYVSYPGDSEDRIAYSISGIGTTPPQHLARLKIFANCEGFNQQYITFQVGTATFGCDEFIVDKEVTADSDTGTIRVYAVVGAYVKWTLVGTATQP